MSLAPHSEQPLMNGVIGRNFFAVKDGESRLYSALDGNAPTLPTGHLSNVMLQPNLNSKPTEVLIHRCGYVLRSAKRATA